MVGELLWLAAVHFALTALPGVALICMLLGRGVRAVPVLLVAGMAATGLSAMTGFWLFFLDPTVGQAFAFFVVFGAVALIVSSGRRLRAERGLLGELATPLLLWAAASVFLLFLGFLHGGTDQPLGIATNRFSGQLPSDNSIPLFFAEWFFGHGHNGTPPVFPGEWLASDRPPLQAAFAMLQRPFGWDSNGLHYQVLAVILQQLWVVALWALLCAARVRRGTRALTLVAVLVSPLVIVNGFFVWPKMLAASFLIGAAALVLTPLWDDLRRSIWGAVLVAALCGLALLSHGSSVFGVIPLVLIAAFRALPGGRWVAVAFLTGCLLMVPWLAYQRYGDPPGNRLTKLTLAGESEVNDTGTVEAVRDAYAEVGFGGALHDKAENFVTMAGGAPAVKAIRNAVESPHLDEAIADVRSVFFFDLLPSMGLLLLAPFAMAVARLRGRPQREDWRFALIGFAAVALGCLFWGLIVFGGAAIVTVLHVGSYALPLLCMAAAVAGLRASFPRFAVFWVGLGAALSLALYVPDLQPPAGTSYSPLAAAISAAALVAFGWIAARGGLGRESQAASTSLRRVPA